MALIPASPYMFKNFELLIEADDFAAHVPSCLFVPSQTISTIKGGTPDAVFSDVSSPTWQCNMQVLADWDNLSSLANYLAAHIGETKLCKFAPRKPKSGPYRVGTASLILGAMPFGGDIDSWNPQTVSHGVNGPLVLSQGAAGSGG